DDTIKNGKIISTVVSTIKTKLIGDDGSYGTAQGIFEGFIKSGEYQMAIGAAFSLFVIIYGMSVAVGMVQVSLGDAAIRVAKMGFVAAFAMNWDIFYPIIGKFFIDGTDEIIGYFTDNFSSLYTTSGDSSGAVYTGSNTTSQIFSGYDDLI